MSASPAPELEDSRLSLEQAQGTANEIVEVEPALGFDLGLVRDEGASDRAGIRIRGDLGCRHPQIEFQPRERRIEAAPCHGPGLREHPSEDGQAIDERLDRDPGVAEDLTP
jgi:hypothetical protein